MLKNHFVDIQLKHPTHPFSFCLFSISLSFLCAKNIRPSFIPVLRQPTMTSDSYSKSNSQDCKMRVSKS